MTPAEWYEAQPKEMLTACNLCGGHRFEPHSDKDRYGLPVSSVRCKGCGLVFINPRMTQEAYTAFYRDGIYRELVSEFTKGEYPDSLAFMEWHQGNYALKVVKHLKGWVNGGAHTLLDVGGSTGVVAELVARKYDLEGTVLEPSEREAARAEYRGLHVIRSTIESHEPADRYDVILLCQTIDHLLDISGALKTIRAMLNPGGRFFVDAVWNTPIKLDHPFYLDDMTAPEYLKRAGFEVLKEYKGPKRQRLNYVCGVP